MTCEIANHLSNAPLAISFLSGVASSTVIAAIVTQLFGNAKERRLGRQGIMNFLTEKVQQLANDPDLLRVIGFLEREVQGDTSDSPMTPPQMRRLVAHLEPIGVFLGHNLDAFPEAYRVFVKEVELCAQSKELWLTEFGHESAIEHYTTSPYWTQFSIFVGATRLNLAELKLSRLRRSARSMKRASPAVQMS